MELWLWVVNGVLWLVAVGFIGIGIWRIIGAFKSLGLVELDRNISSWEKVQERCVRMLPRMKKGGQPAKKIERILDNASAMAGKLELDRIRMMAKHPGSVGGEVGEILATRNIALSAALFALAGFLVGTSAVLIVVF